MNLSLTRSNLFTKIHSRTRLLTTEKPIPGSMALKPSRFPAGPAPAAGRSGKTGMQTVQALRERRARGAPGNDQNSKETFFLMFYDHLCLLDYVFPCKSSGLTFSN